MAENAKVRVIINALTEAAEQNIEDVGDEISGLGDDAAIGQTAMDQLSDEFGEATGQSMILQKALSELEDDMDGVARSGLYAQTAMDQFNDELTETTRSSGIAAGSLTVLQGALSGSAVGSKALSFAFYASLIPALLTLATLIAPIVALLAALTGGALALAGAFGAIVGSGILAFGQKKAEQNKQELAQTERLIAQYESLQKQTGSLNNREQERLKQLRKKKKRLEDAQTATGALGMVMADLKDELVPLITEFGKEFVPLIEDALEAIPTLVRRMIDAVGGTEEFRDALRDFGTVLMEVLPALTGFMFDLARDALPVAREFFAFLQSEGPGAWDAMMESVSRLEPEWRDMLDAMIEMSPVLLEFGTNVGKVVLPALTALIRAATGFMDTVNNMPGIFRGITISALILGPVLLKLVSAFSSILTVITGSGILANLAGLITYFSSASTVTGALASAASWLSGALATLASSTAAVIAGAVALGAAIGLGALKILHMIGVMDWLGDKASALSDMLGPDMSAHFITLISIISFGVIPALALMGAAINELIEGDIDGAIEAVQEMAAIFDYSFAKTRDAVFEFLSDMANMFMAYLGNSIIPDLIFKGLDRIHAGFVDFFTRRIPKAAMSGLTWLIAIVESNLNRIYNTFASVFSAVNSIASSAVESLINSVISALNAFLNTLDGVANAVSDIPGVNAPDIGTLDRVAISDTVVNPKRRSTDVGAIQENRQEQIQQVVQGGINVNVDARGDVQDNPYQWSRTAAQQLQRETRQQYGSNQ